MRKVKEYISKSDIVLGRQCLKAAYMKFHHPELADEKDPYLTLMAERGDHVGEFAQREFPKGVNAQVQGKIELGLKRTKELLEDPTVNTIFEASFLYEGVFVRCDIIHRPNFSKTWELYEVKSGSKLEDKYVFDASIQALYLMKSGFPISKAQVWLLNSKCELPNLTNLFTKNDILDKVPEYQQEISKLVEDLKKVYKMEASPEVVIGDQCTSPYDCPFRSQCFAKYKIPEVSVFDIPRIGKRAWKYFDENKLSIDDVDAKDFTENQQRMILSHQLNKEYVNKEAIKEGINDWQFPLWHIDMEAMPYDLPGFKEMSPTTQLPFQLSISVWRSPKHKIEHLGCYLHLDGSDPRKNVASFLLEHVGDEGSVVSYNKSFEAGKIENLKEFSSKNKNKFKSIANRLVDPLPILRSAVYYPGFKGSHSIKNVAPALLGKESSYENLVIRDGTEAVVRYRQLISLDPKDSKNTEMREFLIQALIDYCNKDVLVMALIVKWLYQQK